MSPLQISAVVCTYDRYDVLPAAIESLVGQSLDAASYRIIVADNSPDREAAERSKERWSEVENLTYLILDRPGLSNARNAAAKEAGTTFVAYMDDDAVASPSWLERVLQAFDTFGERAAIVGGKVNPIWETARPPWLDDRLACYVSAVDWGGELRIAKAEEWFAGTNIAFRTAVLLEAGGFDTKLGRTGGGGALLSNEETILTETLRAAGYHAIYAPEAALDHLVDRKRLTPEWFRKRFAWQSVSDFLAKPDEISERAKNHWASLTEYFAKLPPRERSLRGLFHDTSDPELFREQLSAVYTLTTAALLGFENADR